MMIIGGKAHLLMIMISVVIAVCLYFVVKKSSAKVQNIIIVSLVSICVIGIFFLHGTHYGTELDIQNLLIQMLQVCNFNFILLPLCLFKKNELARQYLFYFSMPMAMSTFVSYPSDVANSMWYSIVCLTFWINHFLISLIPILMIATRKFKPRKEYVLKVIVCMFIYFSIAFIANYILNGFSIIGGHNHSYTMGPGGIMLLKPIYELIPIPYIYLFVLIPIFISVYILISKCFEKYCVNEDFGFICNKKGEGL
jgi:uncharacterized membrane protein YwaF